MYPLALALALTLEPARPIDVTAIDIQRGPGSAHLLVYDNDGVPAAEIVVWLDIDEQPRVDLVFADGLYLSASLRGGEIVDVDTDDAAEVAARLAALPTLPTLPEVTEDEVLQCGVGLLGLAAGASGGPWGVMAGIAGFAVTCGYTLVEELNGDDEPEEEEQQE